MRRRGSQQKVTEVRGVEAGRVEKENIRGNRVRKARLDKVGAL